MRQRVAQKWSRDFVLYIVKHLILTLQWHRPKCLPHFLFYISVSSVRRFCGRQHLPKIRTLFSLVHVKKRSVLISCVFCFDPSPKIPVSLPGTGYAGGSWSAHSNVSLDYISHKSNSLPSPASVCDVLDYIIFIWLTCVCDHFCVCH